MTSALSPNIASAARAFNASSLRARPTVVSIGGYMARPYQMLPLHAVIKSRCDFNVIEYKYHARDMKLSEHAAELAELLLMLKQHSMRCLPEHLRRGGVHFVTHSYGALVLRSALAHVAYSDQECRVAMIAPINQGCWLARLLGSGTLGAGLPVADWVLGKEAGRELIRMTPEEVAKTVPNLPSRFPALVVSGTRNASWGTPLLPSNTSSDGVVMEWETKLDTPAVYTQVAASHTMLLYHPRTWKEVSGFLKDPGQYIAASGGA